MKLIFGRWWEGSEIMARIELSFQATMIGDELVRRKAWHLCGVVADAGSSWLLTMDLRQQTAPLREAKIFYG